MTPTLIGLAGRARTGKDTFANMLAHIVYQSDQRIVQGVAFADALKIEVNPYLVETYGISAFTVNEADKKVIRPHLVERGAGARKEDPYHWIKASEPKVKESLSQGGAVVVKDVRYENEANWVHSLGGKVVYIERILPDGTIQPPANEEEASNDPAAKACADIILTWPTLPLDMLRPYVQDVWNQLNGLPVAPRDQATAIQLSADLVTHAAALKAAHNT